MGMYKTGTHCMNPGAYGLGLLCVSLLRPPGFRELSRHWQDDEVDSTSGTLYPSRIVNQLGVNGIISVGDDLNVIRLRSSRAPFEGFFCQVSEIGGFLLDLAEGFHRSNRS